MLMLGLMVLSLHYCLFATSARRLLEGREAAQADGGAEEARRPPEQHVGATKTDGDAGVEMSEMNEAAEEAAELGEGGNGEVILTREGMDEVRDELTKMRLEQYASEFESGGYDDWKEVLRLPPHRLEKMIEFVDVDESRDRFKEQLREQRRRYGMHQVMPKGAYRGGRRGLCDHVSASREWREVASAQQNFCAAETVVVFVLYFLNAHHIRLGMPSFTGNFLPVSWQTSWPSTISISIRTWCSGRKVSSSANFSGTAAGKPLSTLSEATVARSAG